MSGPAPTGVFQRVLDAVGSAALLFMMLVVFVDVAGRNLINRPLPWGTELLEVVVAVMVFALYPVLALRGAHITVDLISVRAQLRPVQRWVAAVVGAVLFAVIAYCTGRQAVRSAGYGDASPLLQIPTAWVLWGMCALAAVTSLAFLLSPRLTRRRQLQAEPVRAD